MHPQLNDPNKGEDFMREKVSEYLKKPTAKKKAELTTMEQKWCDAQGRDDAKKDDKKPAKP